MLKFGQFSNGIYIVIMLDMCKRTIAFLKGFAKCRNRFVQSSHACQQT